MKKLNCKTSLLLAVLMLVPATGWCAMWTHHDTLDVELSVTDAQGKPIPYPTVWEYVLPRANPLAINRDDLWRLTTRYQDSFEFASPFNRIVPYLEIPPMGDAEGRIRVKVDYSYLEGNDAPRPPLMQVGYTVMKRGYLPARIDFTVHDESHVDGKVVLQRDPDHALETQPYLETYERIRAELSHTLRNEKMTPSNAQREQHLREELEAAAEQAVAAGDKSAAARIYFRMQWLPSATYINGRIAGWEQSNPASEQSRRYLEKACDLNVSNTQIAAACLFDLGHQDFGMYRPAKATNEQKRSFKTYLMKLSDFMNSHKGAVWPSLHELYALWYLRSDVPSERAQARPLLEAVYEYEPKYSTEEELLKTFSILQ